MWFLKWKITYQEKDFIISEVKIELFMLTVSILLLWPAPHIL